MDDSRGLQLIIQELKELNKTVLAIAQMVHQMKRDMDHLGKIVEQIQRGR